MKPWENPYKENIIAIKTFNYGLTVAKICRSIRRREKEYALTSQLLRSGTSIGSNVEEALGAQSKKDFIAKFSIVYKEARETRYWVRILHGIELIDLEEAKILSEGISEILKIVTKILLTSKQNL